MKGQLLLWLLVLLCSSVLAETIQIKGFIDPDHGFVSKLDGSLVEVQKLNLGRNQDLRIDVIGIEGGQYLFEWRGERYRVLIPEVVTNKTRVTERQSCEKTESLVFADDHRIASTRAIEGGCK